MTSDVPLSPPTTRAALTTRAAWWLPVLLLIVASAYSPGLGGGFAFDDVPNLVENTALRVDFGSGWHAWLAAMFSSPASDLQRPLAMLTFALNAACTGLDPWAMKATNIGIHLLNTLLVFAVCRVLLRCVSHPKDGAPGADATALWITAAWSLNPINLPAVLVVVQRMESLSHVFVFGGLWCYLHGRERMLAGERRTGAWLLCVPVATALGLLAKESAALLPAYALALEWLVFGFRARARGSNDRRILAFFACVLVVPAALGLAWLLPHVLPAAAWANRDFGLAERLLTETRVLVDYLHWTLLPDLSQLSLYHDDYAVSHGLLSPPSTLASIALLVLLGALMFWLRKRRPLAALGLAWFLLAHALTATVVPLELVFEHRNYFASFGLCLALGDTLLWPHATIIARRTGILIAGALLVLYAASTAARAIEWRDPVHFAMAEAAKKPRSPRATYSLARTLIILSGYRADSPYAQPAREALENAMSAPGATSLPEAAAILFAARASQPIDPRWWHSLQGKLRGRPIGTQDTSGLAALVDCMIRGQCPPSLDEMRTSFRAALRHGENAEVMNIAGNYALNVEHDPARALTLWRRSAELSPRTIQYQVTMARILIATGRPDAAKPYIRRVRQLGRVGQTASLADSLERRADAASGKLRPLPGPR